MQPVAHGAAAEEIAGEKLGVARRMGDDLRPGKIHVGGIPARQFLAVQSRRHMKVQMILEVDAVFKLIQRDQLRTDGGREVLAFCRAKPDRHFLALKIALRSNR